MDILDPTSTEEPGDVARIVEVAPRTEACIKASFQSMPNTVSRNLCSRFILPKVPTIIAPHLDKVYGDSCSKSTKQADRALAQLQARCWTAGGGFRNDQQQGGGGGARPRQVGSRLGRSHDFHRQRLHLGSQSEKVENNGGHQ